MLGARTKQVNSYGKRGQRIVNVTEQPKDIFADDPPPQWAPLASRMKKRDNVVSKTSGLSPKTVRIHRKKLPSSALQKPSVESRIFDHIETNVSKPRSRLTDSENEVVASPERVPFSDLPLNATRSLAGPAKTRRKKGPSTPRTSLKPRNPSTPSVAVEITVLDNHGKTVAFERRVSHPTVQVNHVTQVTAKPRRGPSKPNIARVEDSTDDELDVQPKRPTRRVALAISSDESESEDEPPPPPPPEIRSPEQLSPPRPSKSTSSRTFLGVVVPSAPYRIPGSPPLTQQQSSPPSIPQDPLPLPTHQRYQHISSPIPRPRQLTPIKRGTARKLFNPSSPASSIDLDLSFDLEELELDEPAFRQSDLPEHEIPQYLKPLLKECYQEESGPADFSSFIEAFAFDPVVQSENGRFTDRTFRKIGEASYSEVFGVGNVVLKIIPLRDETAAGNTEEIDGPFPSDGKDVLREIIVTRAMGEMCHGFVELLKTYVVRGKYPEVLLRLWDEYHETKGSESIRPDTFLVSQYYAIIVLPNGGPDLEAYKFLNPTKLGWRQASSLFWQVARSLALAEQLVSFEHRDLHWGQILVKNLPLTTIPPLQARDQNARARPNLARLPMDDPSHGIQATVIDLGLSRMDAGDGAGGEIVHWTPFEEEVFMGEGDYQFDIYRIMKHHNGDDWEGFKPLTNVFWLHYLTTKLLFSKGLKPPPSSSKPSSSRAEGGAAFTEKDCYDCLVDIDRWLGSCVTAVSPTQIKRVPKQKGRTRKTVAPPPVQVETSIGPSCAGDVVAYAVKKGWVEPVS